MKHKRPLPWWTEYLGLTIDLRFFARKTWKAYVFYIAPILYLLFTPTAMPPTKPQASEPHLPSPTVTFDGSSILAGASSSTISIKVSDAVSVLDSEVVTVKKTSTGGSSIIVPLTGSMFIAGQGVVIVPPAT